MSDTLSFKTMVRNDADVKQYWPKDVQDARFAIKGTLLNSKLDN